MLHPFMPFITEEIWQALPEEYQQPAAARTIMLQGYPQADPALIDTTAEREMEMVQQVIGAVRNIRGEMNIPPAKEADLILNCASQAPLDLIGRNAAYLHKLARVGRILYNQPRPAAVASAVAQGVEILVPLAELIDVDVEKKRLEKEIARIEAQLFGLNNKLMNRDFNARAPKEVIEKEEKKRADFSHTLEKLQESLKSIAGDA